jgi:hypothetical protein
VFGKPGPSEGEGLHLVDFLIEQIKANFVMWNAEQDILIQVSALGFNLSTCIDSFEIFWLTIFFVHTKDHTMVEHLWHERKPEEWLPTVRYPALILSYCM